MAHIRLGSLCEELGYKLKEIAPFLKELGISASAGHSKLSEPEAAQIRKLAKRLRQQGPRAPQPPQPPQAPERTSAVTPPDPWAEEHRTWSSQGLVEDSPTVLHLDRHLASEARRSTAAMFQAFLSFLERQEQSAPVLVLEAVRSLLLCGGKRQMIHWMQSGDGDALVWQRQLVKFLHPVLNGHQFPMPLREAGTLIGLEADALRALAAKSYLTAGNDMHARQLMRGLIHREMNDLAPHLALVDWEQGDEEEAMRLLQQHHSLHPQAHAGDLVTRLASATDWATRNGLFEQLSEVLRRRRNRELPSSKELSSIEISHSDFAFRQEESGLQSRFTRRWTEFQSSGRFMSAAEHFLEEVRALPSSGLAWRYLGMSYDALCHPNEATICHYAAAELDQDEASWVSLARTLEPRRQPLRALYACLQALRMNPQNSQAHALLKALAQRFSASFSGIDRFANLRKATERRRGLRVSELEPVLQVAEEVAAAAGTEHVNRLLGVLYECSGDSTRAVQSYLKELRSTFESTRAARIAALALSVEEPAVAEEIGEEFKRRDPESAFPESIRRAVDSLHAASPPHPALIQFLAMYPSVPALTNLLEFHDACIASGDHDLGKKVFAEMTALHPADLPSMVCYANFLELTDDIEGAYQVFSTILKLNPKMTAISKVLLFCARNDMPDRSKAIGQAHAAQLSSKAGAATLELLSKLSTLREKAHRDGLLPHYSTLCWLLRYPGTHALGRALRSVLESPLMLYDEAQDIVRQNCSRTIVQTLVAEVTRNGGVFPSADALASWTRWLDPGSRAFVERVRDATEDGFPNQDHLQALQSSLVGHPFDSALYAALSHPEDQQCYLMVMALGIATTPRRVAAELLKNKLFLKAETPRRECAVEASRALLPIPYTHLKVALLYFQELNWKMAEKHYRIISEHHSETKEAKSAARFASYCQHLQSLDAGTFDPEGLSLKEARRFKRYLDQFQELEPYGRKLVESLPSLCSAEEESGTDDQPDEERRLLSDLKVSSSDHTPQSFSLLLDDEAPPPEYSAPGEDPGPREPEPARRESPVLTESAQGEEQDFLESLAPNVWLDFLNFSPDDRRPPSVEIAQELDRRLQLNMSGPERLSLLLWKSWLYREVGKREEMLLALADYGNEASAAMKDARDSFRQKSYALEAARLLAARRGKPGNRERFQVLLRSFLRGCTHLEVPEILRLTSEIGVMHDICKHSIPDDVSKALRNLQTIVRLAANCHNASTPGETRVLRENLLLAMGQATKQVSSRVNVWSLKNALRTLLQNWQAAFLEDLRYLSTHPSLRIELQNARFLQDGAIFLEIHNEGRGIARGVEVSLNAGGAGRIIGERSQRVEQLCAHERRGLRFQGETTSETLELEAAASFVDPTGRRDSVSVQGTLQVRTEEAAFKILPNRYHLKAVSSPGDFYGRRRILDTLVSGSGTGTSEHIFVLHGLNRVGKTSLLHQLTHELDDMSVPVFIDLQGVAGASTANLVYFGFAKRIRQALESRRLSVELPVREEFKEDPFLILDDFLDECRATASGLKIVLLLDEFERLVEDVSVGHHDPSILGHLRSMMQHRRELGFVLAGAQRIIEKLRDHAPSILNMSVPIEVDVMEPDEIIDLIQKPGLGQITFHPSSVQEICRVAGGHPYYTKVMCQELVQWLNRERRDHVYLWDVQQITDFIVRNSQSNYFDYLWDFLGPEERLVISAIAESDHALELNSLHDRLSPLTQTSKRQLAEITRTLETRKLLARVGGTDQGAAHYQVAIALCGMWFRYHKPLERTLMEVTVGREA